MKENIEQLNHLADVLYSQTKELDSISIYKARYLQDLLDEMQEILDDVTNELHCPE